MNRNATIVACFIACLASVGTAASSLVPVAYGAGEMTSPVAVTSIISTLTALISGAGGLFALLKKADAGEVIKRVADLGGGLIGGERIKPIVNAIKDATDLLPLIAKNEGGVEMSAVRVAIFTLEIHCSIRKPEILDQVHALAKALLVVVPVKEPA